MVRASSRNVKAKSPAADPSLVEETGSVKARGKSAKRVSAADAKGDTDKKTTVKRKSVADVEVEVNGSTGGAEKPAAKKRKTKAEKEEENMPLAARTVISSMKRAMYIGAHVSGAGGLPLPAMASVPAEMELTPPPQVSKTRCKTLSTSAQTHLLCS